MASIGQLSAGIAHEINNPVGFITSNLQTLSDYFNSLEKVLKSITQTIGQSKDTALNEACQKILKQGQVDLFGRHGGVDYRISRRLFTRHVDCKKPQRVLTR